MLSGQRVVSARFTFLKPSDNGGVQEYFSVEFKDGMITSMSVSGEFEQLTFSFQSK